MKQTNLTVNPIVGATMQKGTPPSDTEAQYFYISREILSKNKRTAKYVKLFSDLVGGNSAAIVIPGPCAHCGINQMSDCVIDIES